MKTAKIKRPTTIRMTPDLQAAVDRYAAENETNLSQIARQALRRFLEGQGYLPAPADPKGRPGNAPHGRVSRERSSLADST